MASWQEELDGILQDKHVHYEEQTEPALFLVQVSRRRPGVMYRMDCTGRTPELRVFVPTDENTLKFHAYLVTLAPHSLLSQLFVLYMTYEGGSDAFEHVNGHTTILFFQMLIETMKQLFWQGDVEALEFAPEIVVQMVTR